MKYEAHWISPSAAGGVLVYLGNIVMCTRARVCIVHIIYMFSARPPEWSSPRVRIIMMPGTPMQYTSIIYS